MSAKLSKYISTSATTVVSDTQGTLGSIIITEDAAGTITVYNNSAASGDIIALFKASAPVGEYKFDVRASKGITVVTGAATKLTVTYSKG